MCLNVPQVLVSFCLANHSCLQHSVSLEDYAIELTNDPLNANYNNAVERQWNCISHCVGLCKETSKGALLSILADVEVSPAK